MNVPLSSPVRARPMRTAVRLLVDRHGTAAGKLALQFAEGRAPRVARQEVVVAVPAGVHGGGAVCELRDCALSPALLLTLLLVGVRDGVFPVHALALWPVAEEAIVRAAEGDR